jgi:CheY-like chemotaxis protein
MMHPQQTQQLLYDLPTPIHRHGQPRLLPSVGATQEPQARQPAPLFLLPASTRSASPVRERPSMTTSDDHCLIPFPVPADPPAAPVADAGPQPRPLILIVEDDESISTLLEDFFELEGFAVETAFLGATGLLRLAAGGVDLLVLDLKLPDISGLVLCQRIRAREDEQRQDSRTPIVVLTAAVQGDMAATCRRAGADDFVRKPFEIEALLATVQQRLAISRTAPGERC